MHSFVKVSSHEIISEGIILHCQVIFTFAHSPQFPYWTAFRGKAGVDLALNLADWHSPSDVYWQHLDLPALAKLSSPIWRNYSKVDSQAVKAGRALGGYLLNNCPLSPNLSL